MSNKSKIISTALTVIGSVGVVATAVLAAKATPKAMELVKMNSILNHDGDAKAYTTKEAIRYSWKCYIPAGLVGLSTITCVLGAHLINRKSQASLVGVYGMLNESYQKYRGAAKSVYGEDADSKIQAEMAKDVYVSAGGIAVYSPEFEEEEDDKELFYDIFSKRYFRSTLASVLNAQYHVNRNLSLWGLVSLNKYYEFLGLDDVDHGDEIGWSSCAMAEGGYGWLDFENIKTVMDDGMECYVVSAMFDPIKEDFD